MSENLCMKHKFCYTDGERIKDRESERHTQEA